MGQDAVAGLDLIRVDHPNNVMECCSRMFSKWRQRTPNINWKDLIKALKEVELVQLASEIEELLIPFAEGCIEHDWKILQQQLEKQLPSQGIFI